MPIRPQREGETIYLFYNAVLLLFSPILLILLLARLSRGKSREGWSERWGRIDVRPRAGGKRVWAHAASVGEVLAATPVLQAYHALRPDDEIMLSVITPGGHEVASSLIGKCVTSVFYSPFDAPFAVKQSVRRVRPDVFVNLETELWPNLLCLLRRTGSRLILVNGRISDISYPSYRRMRLLFRWVLGQFDRILAQTDTDAERLRSIGAPPERVAVGGNAKFDQAADRLTAAEVAALRADFRLSQDAPVLVIGSTRQAGEERIILESIVAIRSSRPELMVIHAPRHVDRAAEVAQLYAAASLATVRRTEMDSAEGPAEVIVLDTFGELGRLYALADVVFIGNSLTAPGGGQNILQPLAQGKPVLYGPYMQNFRDLAAMAEAAEVAWRVEGASELAGRTLSLLDDREARDEIASRAVDLIQRNRGAAHRYATEIAALMEARR